MDFYSNGGNYSSKNEFEDSGANPSSFTMDNSFGQDPKMFLPQTYLLNESEYSLQGFISSEQQKRGRGRPAKRNHEDKSQLVKPEVKPKKLAQTSPQPSSSTAQRAASPFNGTRGRPVKGKSLVGFEQIPASRCSYKKHSSYDRLQKLWITTSMDSTQGHEYGYYSKCNEPDGTIINGFYCMGCTGSRGKREMDAVVKFEPDGREIFLIKSHVSECKQRTNDERYDKVNEPVTTSELQIEIRELVKTAVEESSKQIMNNFMDQIRGIIREEVSTQLRAFTNNVNHPSR